MDDWQTKKLGDICAFVRGPFGGSLKKNIFKNNGYAVYEQRHAIYNNFKDIRYYIDKSKFDEMKRFQIRSGDLIMSCSGTMGKVAIIPDEVQDGIINQALLILSPKKGLFNKYLKMWMESDNFQQSLKKLSSGAAIKNVASVQILKQIEIQLPLFSEQKRIVRILDDVFENIDKARENTEKNLQNSKDLFEAFLENAFSGKNWKVIPISERCQTGAGGTPLKSHKEYYEGGKIPWLRSGEVDKKEITKSEIFITEKGMKNSSARLFPSNTVLVAMYGATAGQVGILKFESTTNQAVCGILPNKYFVPEFVYYVLLSKKQELVSQAVGGAQPNISQIKVKNTLLPDINIATQNLIVKKLYVFSEQTKKLGRNYKQKLLLLDELKKSVLQKAFSGNL